MQGVNWRLELGKSKWYDIHYCGGNHALTHHYLPLLLWFSLVDVTIVNHDRVLNETRTQRIASCVVSFRRSPQPHRVSDHGVHYLQYYVSIVLTVDFISL